LWGMTVERPFYALAYLAKALGATADATQLHIVTHQAWAVTGRETLSPAQAALFGLNQTIPQEYPHLSSQALDIAATDELTAGQLRAECTAATPASLVAWRGRRRGVQTFVPAPLQEPETGVFRSDGTYLIIGGLADIGYDLARTLAEKTAANLLLIDE